MKEKLFIFLKGFLMGICDLIPGISGGTIAFITGIYTRLINSITSINLNFFSLFFNLIINKDKKSLKEFKKAFKKIDIWFLSILLLGILSSILIGSRIIKFLLDNYFAYTLSFFIGLILASSKIIFDNIKNHKLKNVLFGVLGVFIGVIISFLVPIEVLNPGKFYIFISGFFAISAMFLPGISGAFILFIMGMYEFIINSIQNITKNLINLVIFILGILTGAIFISRVISYLFKKDKCKTLYFLLGLVLGCLTLPIKRIFSSVEELYSLDGFIIGVYLILGVLLVVIVNYGIKNE